jgi:predicted short-subunit dehydrogenase-like oxidoreductase (DUF2520 family)
MAEGPLAHPRVAIVGAGRMGQGIGLALAARGWDVQLLARSPRAVAPPLGVRVDDWEEATRAADVVLLATPDAAIGEVVRRLADRKAVGPRQVVLHLSGVLDHGVLDPLVPAGAGLGSFHPLQTVAEPPAARESFRGAYAGLEGDERAVAAARQLAEALGMHPVLLGAGVKALYHAGAVIAANYTVALAGVAERLAREAGVPAEVAGRMYLPLLEGAVANVARLGPVRALTGPIRRGDLLTIRAHRAALAPRDRALYQTVGRAALDLARAAGLPDAAAASVERLLEEPAMPEPVRRTVSSGAPWEATVGYSRAIRVGPHVHVSGTTAAGADGRVTGPGDAYAQTVAILGKIEAALEQAGARLEHVVRTRIFVTDIGRWEEVGRAHGEVFGRIRPAATMVEVRRLIAPEMLVEIEADAYVS